MKFSEYPLRPETLRGIEALGFKRPTDIQYKSIPPITRKEDVLAVAQTGTGKTAAFAIPVIDYIHRLKRGAKRKDGVRCVVLVPTHELAMQISQVFQDIGKYTQVKTFAIFGGVEQDPQIARLEKQVDVLVATPGRMFDLMAQGHLRLNRVEILILDEADHMLDLGFIDDIRDLNKRLGRRRQTLFFSATINDRIKKLAYSLIRQNAIRIRISPKNPVAKNIEHSVLFVKMDDKRFFLERIIRENPDKKILVFVRTKVRAERVKKAMERVKIPTLTIHSDKDQHKRTDILNQFKSGDSKILIATDVTARGIDIPNVELVLNYDLPEQAENYVHRVGRTGRGKEKGQAISFCSEREKEILEEIQCYLSQKIEVLEMSPEDYQDTVLLAEGKNLSLDDMLKEIEELKDWKRKKKKQKKKRD